MDEGKVIPFPADRTRSRGATEATAGALCLALDPPPCVTCVEPGKCRKLCVSTIAWEFGRRLLERAGDAEPGPGGDDSPRRASLLIFRPRE